tara:strand:+ start:41 stop:388 length:348 start_codon:yes stop_codon:yes gene_type:complete
MALNLKPLIWNWSPIVAGDTYPAANIVESAHTENLDRVRIKLRISGSTTTALTLDSDTTGIVINNAAAWDFTISEIDTTSLATGVYSYQLETTTTGGTIRTEFAGTWPILSDTTP